MTGRHFAAVSLKVVDVNLEAVPEPWKSQMQNRGISSIRDLSRKSGLSVETVRKTVYGLRRSTPPTVAALAEALGLPEARVNNWIGYKGTDTNEPYTPPVESSRLNQRQRTALDELIRSMTARVGESNDSPMNHAEGNSAPGEVTELFTPPPPIEATAAKRGKNTGRTIRRKQDEDAERPDPDPDED